MKESAKGRFFENTENEVNQSLKNEEEFLSERRYRRILEKREREDRQEEERKLKAEEIRLNEIVTEANRVKSKNNKRKHEKKPNYQKCDKKSENTIMDIDTNDTEIAQNVKHIHPDVKELPQNVKVLHPDCVEFIVEGNGACCLNCLAAFIYLDPKEGPTLGRDLNTHMATYRQTYSKRLVFP